ncbi:HAMP domain-containing sensor histidine kinase [Brevibacillus nitrificans]|uniref:sensor histidine kinase n=1 Tax=Brevibacillus nitrificans TaxID=651560 RepID=UPI0028668FFD|nr:HAMP domain-containing sensor histidine kinase [Brevibacillus nitrificans]MDR7315714.1 signal transduction histidine kinase [Brevibacillus nitrificans]
MKNHNRELFRGTRKRLTIINSGMLMVVLLLFIISTFGLLFSILYNEQKLELKALTQQEVEESLTVAPGDTKPDNANPANQGMYFNYFLKEDGALLVGDEFAPDMREAIMEYARGWKPNVVEIQYKTIENQKKSELHLLIAAQNVYHDGRLMGTVYFGKDVSYLWSMFQWLLVVMLGMSVLFLGVAIVTGQFLTRRAMKPILRSYELQRDFLADASHELRTPISILKSGLEVIGMEDGDKLSSFSHELLQDLQKEAKSAAKMVSDLLLLARTDSGVQEISMETFDFSVMAGQVIRSIQGFAQSRKIRLHLHGQDSIMLYADQERIKQLLYILLDNAVKYTPEQGEITLTVKTTMVDYKPKLCIIVKDTGIGIEADQLPQIFHRFYRADKNRSRQSGGTGLGLAIAKWIIDAHRGTIHVESVPGVGSTFTVFLPIK